MSEEIEKIETEETTDMNMVEPPKEQKMSLTIQVAGHQHDIIASGVSRIDKDPFFGGKKTIVFESSDGVSARIGIDKLEAIIYQ